MKPIIFNGDMMLALLEGRKTQTRRPLKPQPEYGENKSLPGHMGTFFKDWNLDHPAFSPADILEYCPFGHVDDLLWVQEGYQLASVSRKLGATGVYTSDGTKFYNLPVIEKEFERFKNRKKPFSKLGGMYMFTSLSRLTLRITDVTVQRIQEINEESAVLEGFKYSTVHIDGDEIKTTSYAMPARSKFADAWNKIYNDWAANPWVWVISFEVIKRNVKELS